MLAKLQARGLTAETLVTLLGPDLGDLAWSQSIVNPRQCWDSLLYFTFGA